MTVTKNDKRYAYMGPPEYAVPNYRAMITR